MQEGWGEAPRKWTCDHNGRIALVPDLVPRFLLTNHDLTHGSVLDQVKTIKGRIFLLHTEQEKMGIRLPKLIT